MIVSAFGQSFSIFLVLGKFEIYLLTLFLVLNSTIYHVVCLIVTNLKMTNKNALSKVHHI